VQKQHSDNAEDDDHSHQCYLGGLNMARLPTGPYKTGRTGCYGCKRETTRDGGCGVHGYPCIHRGLDLFAESPDVFAPEGGQIIAVSDGKSAPFQGYGPGVVLLKGASGYYHLLGHLNPTTFTVRKDAFVLEGQKLAQLDVEVNKHTHWEVRKQATGPSQTNTVSPLAWLAAQQRPRVALISPTEPSAAKKFWVGVAFVGGVGALSLLALRIAKTAAHAV
jgi:murein DD-endopeptidase MepM/ murein hydrolase activator NlpD